MRCALLAGAIALSGCTPPFESGPFRISIPDGWSVKSASGTALKLVDVSATASKAKAREPSVVLDIFNATSHTSATYQQLIEPSAESFESSNIQIDGQAATQFLYGDPSLGGPRMAVVVDNYRVLVVYRPAAPHDQASFDANREIARAAIRSMKWTEPPD